MPTFPATTTGNEATSPVGWSNGGNGNQEVIASANDSTFDYDTTNSTGSVSNGWLLNNTPGDFGTMDAGLTIQVRTAWNSTPGGSLTWDSIGCYITDSAGTTQLAGGSSTLGVAQTISGANLTTATPGNSTATGFTYVNTTADQTAWDGAILVLTNAYTRTKGGDGTAREVYALEITGTYSAATTNVTLTAATSTETAQALTTKKTRGLHAPANHTDADVTSGLSVAPDAYYKLDESSGTLADSANSNDLAITAGTVTYSEDGVRADGNSSVRLGGDCELTATGFSPFTAGNDLSVAFWGKVPPGSPMRYVWCGDENSVDYPYSLLGTVSGDLRLAFSPNTLTGNKVVTLTGGDDGGWHHWAFSFDNSADTVDFWIDGVAQTQATGVTGDFATADVLRLGSSPIDGNYLDGWLDEFILFENKLLTGDDVNTLVSSSRETAQALSPAKKYSLTPSASTESGQALTTKKQVTLGQGAETDAAQALSIQGPQEVALVAATTTAAAQPLTTTKKKSLGQATTTIAAQALTTTKKRALGQGTSTETAQALATTKKSALTASTSVESGQALTTTKKKGIAPAASTESAQILSPGKKYSVVAATSAEAGQALTYKRKVTLTPATETDNCSGVTSTAIPEATKLRQTLMTLLRPLIEPDRNPE